MCLMRRLLLARQSMALAINVMHGNGHVHWRRKLLETGGAGHAQRN